AMTRNTSNVKKSSVIIIVLVLFFLVVFILHYKLHLVEDDDEVKTRLQKPLVAEPVPVTVSPPEEPAAAYPQPLANPPQRSKYAYITLLSGINPQFTHRGYLYNALIMKKALEKLGSAADFIVMVGYQNDPSKFNNRQDVYNEDLNLLKANNIIIYELPRYLS